MARPCARRRGNTCARRRRTCRRCGPAARGCRSRVRKRRGSRWARRLRPFITAVRHSSFPRTASRAPPSRRTAHTAPPPRRRLRCARRYRPALAHAKPLLFWTGPRPETAWTRRVQQACPLPGPPRHRTPGPPTLLPLGFFTSSHRVLTRLRVRMRRTLSRGCTRGPAECTNCGCCLQTSWAWRRSRSTRSTSKLNHPGKRQCDGAWPLAN